MLNSKLHNTRTIFNVEKKYAKKFSNNRLDTLLYLHLYPINLVVFKALKT